MAFNTRTISIIVALVIAIGFIGGAYVLSGPNSFFHTRLVNAQSTAELLKNYASKDTDGDGLPDWEEALYGTDPTNPHSISPTLTDSQALAKGLIKPKFSASVAPATTTPQQALDTIPGPTPDASTLTAQFSQVFLQDYGNAVAQSGSQTLSDTDKQALLDQLQSEFTQRAQQLVLSHYTAISVHTSTSVTVTQYAGSVEKVLASHDVPEVKVNVLTLTDNLMEKNDESARPQLKALAASYSAIATDLAALSVPPQLAGDHLLLMQSFDTLGRSTKLVANYEQDPVAVLGALAEYQPVAGDLNTAFEHIATTILAQGEPAPGEPGASIVSIARSAQTQPQTP